MTHTSVTSFAHADEQAQQWVNELAQDLDWSEQRAYRFLKSVLHTLRDWLSPKEMADLSAQLPTLIRGMYFEGWRPSGEPMLERKKRDFVICVRNSFGYELDVDIDKAIEAVFKLLDHHVSHGEIVQVRNSMKKSLRQLWRMD
ncbi:DUF2267 domain-containing protein [Mesorhizobium sp.]|uniref:DUF2267 domain-containing protein n=1 Tax=Mesorhizobium sp. TaxID=1871066 RepID=UPI001205475C|nr:DUF2267 domain-containing protein [Mesorhizobium sp.]TIQ27709.1 MAG: DUF2267 domain-containing protein [Mesorhizobium sp.]